MKYTDHFSTQATPQTEKLPGTNQERNNAGGFSFVLDRWGKLQRFLVLGSEGGTYYVSEQKLTKDNAQNVLACIDENGKRVVDLVVEISDKGRAPKNDPALFVLALAASFGDVPTKQYAWEKLPKVARIATHLFIFAESIRNLRGWSKQVSRGMRNWYESKSAKEIAHQLTKYQSRNGWAHGDILKLSHIKTSDEEKALLYKWAIKGETFLDVMGEAPTQEGMKRLWAHEKAKRSDENEIIRLIEEFHLPWESIPTDKRTAKIWETLLPGMGLTALLRNLGNLSSHGVIREGGWNNLKIVQDRLTNSDALKKARIHPLAVLGALTTYSQGHGVRGQKTWTVVPEVKEALNQAFYASFDNVVPANKRFLLGVDVSGSMTMGNLAGMPGITPRIGSAAMAMVTYRTEPMTVVRGFCHEFIDLGISKRDTLEAVANKMDRLPFGGTDCSLPMVYAQKNNIEIDTFVIYTDSETYFGRSHPIQELRRYRDKTGIPAKLIVVGMTSTGFTIADPNDAGCLDVVGFDSSAPQLIRDFAAGEI